MAVAHDASTLISAASTDPVSSAFSPVGTPRAIIIMIAQAASSADSIVSVDYGGVTVPRVRSDSTASAEPGRTYAYFLGSNIPTGTQTVTVDKTGALTMTITCTSLTASGDCEVVDHDGTAGVLSGVSLTLSYGGRSSIALASAYGGHTTPSTVTFTGGETVIRNDDQGSTWTSIARQTTPQTGDTTTGYSAASDDTAFSCLAISEILATAPTPDLVDGRRRYRRALIRT